MKLLVNGEIREFREGLLLEELIQELGLQKDAVVAEVNRKIVQPAERTGWGLADGDQVELIQFVGGG